MKTKGVALLIVGILVVVALSVIALANPIWPTPTAFGAWGQEIVIEYADGTRQSLKLVFDVPGLAMFHEGKPVVAIHYILDAKASDGSGTLETDISGFRYVFELEQSGVAKYTATRNPSLLIENDIIPTNIDGNWHMLFTHPSGVTYLNAVSKEVGDGTFSLWIKPGGTLRYRIQGDTEWTTANLPDEVAFTVTTSDTGNGSPGNIVVSYKSRYKVYTVE